MTIVACELFDSKVYVFTSQGDVWRVQVDTDGYLLVDDPEDKVPQSVIDKVNANWGE